MGVMYSEYRCKQCHHLLFKGLLVEGEIEVKCRRCSELSSFTITSCNELLCLIPQCPHRVSYKDIDHS